MSKLSYRLLIILLSIIVYIVTVFPRGGYFSFLGISGFPLSILLGTIVYYIFIALLLSSKRGKQNKIFLLIAVIAPFVPEFIIRIFDWSETLVSFPDNLFKLIAILTSWIVFGYTKNTYRRERYSLCCHCMVFFLWIRLLEQLHYRRLFYRKEISAYIKRNKSAGCEW